MAGLTVTSLNGAITLNARQITLTAFTNPSSGKIGADTMLLVDGEVMRVTDASLTPTLSVTRGDTLGSGSTKAAAHNTLAPVTYGLTSDFTTDASTTGVTAQGMYSYGVSGAITVPVGNTTIYLTKATAAAMTLAGPNNDQTNSVKVISLTAAAHTITYTAGFYQNTTSSDVVTFPSTSGATFMFTARNGVWNCDVGGGTTGGVTGPA